MESHVQAKGLHKTDAAEPATHSSVRQCTSGNKQTTDTKQTEADSRQCNPSNRVTTTRDGGRARKVRELKREPTLVKAFGSKPPVSRQKPASQMS